MRIAIIAGETSGDLLGAGLLESLKQQLPQLQAEGIAGPRMQAAGCVSHYPMERLSVLGLFEALGRLPELLAARSRLKRRFLADPPDLFIGIDAPDFNLPLARELKRAGIKTAHYVSPSVWAWRHYRIKKIVSSLDLMMVLFPFEAAFYRGYEMPVEFVGHPLADLIPRKTDQGAARRQIGLPEGGQIVALLPGSRLGEVSRLTVPMIAAARWLRERLPELEFCAPLVSPVHVSLFKEELAAQGLNQGVHLFDGQSREVMTAADAVLLASGTATLEAMLLKKPMVVTYIANAMSYRILKPWLSASISYIALPNLLADRMLVPEVLQYDVTPRALAEPLLKFLTRPEGNRPLFEAFDGLHIQLKRGASERAAQAVLRLLGCKAGGDG